jgi:hypothetical protein
LAGHADHDAADAVRAAEERAEAGDDGRRAGRGVEPGAGVSMVKRMRQRWWRSFTVPPTALEQLSEEDTDAVTWPAR